MSAELAHDTRSDELLEILHRLHPDGLDGEVDCELQLDLMQAVEALVQFEADISAIVEDAQRMAESVHQQAVVEVRRIDDEAAAQLECAAVQADGRQPEARQRTIMQQASQDVERAHRDAATRISEIVAAATAVVWAAVTPETTLRVA